MQSATCLTRILQYNINIIIYYTILFYNTHHRCALLQCAGGSRWHDTAQRRAQRRPVSAAAGPEQDLSGKNNRCERAPLARRMY